MTDILCAIKRCFEEIDRDKIAVGEIKQLHPELTDTDTEHPIRKCQYNPCQRLFLAGDPGQLFCSNYYGTWKERVELFQHIVWKSYHAVNHEILNETDYFPNVSRKRRRKIIRTRSKKILKQVLYNIINSIDERPHEIAKRVVETFNNNDRLPHSPR